MSKFIILMMKKLLSTNHTTTPWSSTTKSMCLPLHSMKSKLKLNLSHQLCMSMMPKKTSTSKSQMKMHQPLTKPYLSSTSTLVLSLTTLHLPLSMKSNHPSKKSQAPHKKELQLKKTRKRLLNKNKRSQLLPSRKQESQSTHSLLSCSFMTTIATLTTPSAPNLHSPPPMMCSLMTSPVATLLPLPPKHLSHKNKKSTTKKRKSTDPPRQRSPDNPKRKTASSTSQVSHPYPISTTSTTSQRD